MKAKQRSGKGENMLGTGSGGVVRAGYVLTSWVYRANELRACLCLHSRHFAHRTALSRRQRPTLFCVCSFAFAISRIGSRERNEALRGACILLHYNSLRDHEASCSDPPRDGGHPHTSYPCGRSPEGEARTPTPSTEVEAEPPGALLRVPWYRY